MQQRDHLPVKPENILQQTDRTLHWELSELGWRLCDEAWLPTITDILDWLLMLLGFLECPGAGSMSLSTTTTRSSID